MMAESDFNDVARTYDSIANEYREAKKLPLQEHIFDYTVFRLAGGVAGKRVLDLACGEGHYARLMKRGGAADVLGVDISKQMIKLAEATESTEPLGVRYRVADVTTLELGPI